MISNLDFKKYLMTNQDLSCFTASCWCTKSWKCEYHKWYSEWYIQWHKHCHTMISIKIKRRLIKHNPFSVTGAVFQLAMVILFVSVFCIYYFINKSCNY